MSKLDPELEILSQARREPDFDRGSVSGLSDRSAEELAIARAARHEPARVKVFLQFTGDLARIEAAGFEAMAIVGDIAVGEVELDKLETIARLDNVVRIEMSHPLQPHLNVSAKEIRVDQVHNPPLALKGKGVIVGVIDNGIDYQHPSFIRADGISRIRLILDMSLEPQNGEKRWRSSFPGGVIYTNNDINAALKEGREGRDPLNVVRTQVRSGETMSHGTHVAGIAVGNGLATGGCYSPSTFVGVAPEADLIFVKAMTRDYDTNQEIWAEDADVLIAIVYILSEAADRPIAINMSLGHHDGPHDGTSLYEAGMDALLDKPGRAIVVSAGNEGEGGVHASGKVSSDPSGTEVRFYVDELNERISYKFYVWYPGGDRFDFCITTPGGAKSRRYSPGQTEHLWQFPNGNDLTVNSQLNASTTGDNLIFFIISGARIQPGTWILTLIGTTVTDGQFHCWVNSTAGLRFVGERCDDTHTISIPGNAQKVITVGAYVTSPIPFLDGRLSDSSSRGPTRDGRTKPEITAPGEAITSARAKLDTPDCFELCLGPYKSIQGTSQAAPHVAGVIALMFQKNPSLTNEQIRDHLFATTRKDSFTGPLVNPDNKWGHGKVTAAGAVNRVPSPPPGPAPAPPSPMVEALPDEPAVGSGGQPRPWHEIQQEILETPDGERYMALIARHLQEIRALITTNKRVAAVWRRNGGPLLLQHVVEALQWPDRPLPALIDGYPVVERVKKILAILKRYGSASLAADIDEHTPSILELNGLSLNQFLSSQHTP